MDEIRIYNRTLSAAEVYGLYAGAGTGAESRNLNLTRQPPSSIRLYWDGRSNALYQVEYRSQLGSGAWIPLGLPGLSDGSGQSVLDTFLTGSNRLYRVRPLP